MARQPPLRQDACAQRAASGLTGVGQGQAHQWQLPLRPIPPHQGRRGPTATVAIALLGPRLAYHILSRGVPYDDLGEEYFERRRPRTPSATEAGSWGSLSALVTRSPSNHCPTRMTTRASGVEGSSGIFDPEAGATAIDHVRSVQKRLIVVNAGSLDGGIAEVQAARGVAALLRAGNGAGRDVGVRDRGDQDRARRVDHLGGHVERRQQAHDGVVAPTYLEDQALAAGAPAPRGRRGAAGRPSRGSASSTPHIRPEPPDVAYPVTSRGRRSGGRSARCAGDVVQDVVAADDGRPRPRRRTRPGSRATCRWAPGPS